MAIIAYTVPPIVYCSTCGDAITVKFNVDTPLIFTMQCRNASCADFGVKYKATAPTTSVSLVL